VISSNRKEQAETWGWKFHPRVLACVLTIISLGSTEARQKEKSDPDTAELEAPVQEALLEANPDYEGEGKLVVRDGKIHTITLMRCKGIKDLSPLSRFPLESVTNVILYNSVNCQ
jgi:hypothetical protein